MYISPHSSLSLGCAKGDGMIDYTGQQQQKNIVRDVLVYLGQF